MKKVLLMTILASLTFPSVALGMNGAGITGEISIGNDEEKTRIMYMSQYHHMGYRCLPQGELIIRWPLGAEDETLYFALEVPVDPSMTADGESFLDIYDVKDGEIEYLSDNSFAVTGTDMKNAKTIPFMKIMPRDTPDAVWHAFSWNIEEKEYVEKSDVLMQKMFTYRQENGTYMIPGRFWIEEFSRRGGMEWQWNSKDKSFHVFKNEKEYIFTAGQNYVSVNGQKFYFMATPEIVDGRIYIPLDMMKLMWKDKSEVIELDGKIQLVVCV